MTSNLKELLLQNNIPNRVKLVLTYLEKLSDKYCNESSELNQNIKVMYYE